MCSAGRAGAGADNRQLHTIVTHAASPVASLFTIPPSSADFDEPPYWRADEPRHSPRQAHTYTLLVRYRHAGGSRYVAHPYSQGKGHRSEPSGRCTAGRVTHDASEG